MRRVLSRSSRIHPIFQSSTHTIAFINVRVVLLNKYYSCAMKTEKRNVATTAVTIVVIVSSLRRAAESRLYVVGGEIISLLYCNTFSINISPKTDVECDLSGVVLLVLHCFSFIRSNFGTRTHILDDFFSSCASAVFVKIVKNVESKVRFSKIVHSRSRTGLIEIIFIFVAKYWVNFQCGTSTNRNFHCVELIQRQNRRKIVLWKPISGKKKLIQ